MVPFACSICGSSTRRLYAAGPGNWVCDTCMKDCTARLVDEGCLPAIELGEFEIDSAVIRRLPVELAKQHDVIAVTRAGGTLIVAMAAPSAELLHLVDGWTTDNIEPVIATSASIRAAWDRFDAG